MTQRIPVVVYGDSIMRATVVEQGGKRHFTFSGYAPQLEQAGLEVQNRAKYGATVDARMQALVALCGFKYEKIFGVPYSRKTDKNIGFDKYRVETGDSLRKNETDYTPYEIVALIKSALEDKVALYMEEIMIIACNLFRIAKPTDKFAVYVNDCVTLGEEKGLFVRSVSDRISLA